MRDVLKSLRGKSRAELVDRCRQSACKMAERIGGSAQTRLPAMATLFRAFEFRQTGLSTEELLSSLRRQTPRLFRSFDDPEETVDVLRKRFPDEAKRIVDQADRICEGFFDLLGYQALFFRDQIPDWHFDPISKSISPRVHWSKIREVDSSITGDKKVIWELNRHQYFTTLGQAYWLTHDERYARTFNTHLTSWFVNNPPKIGVNWLSSLELALRSISWILGFHFFKDSPNFTSAAFVQMLKFLYLQGRHIETYLSTYFSPNTHLTGEALGLYFLGTFLPEVREAERWRDLGYKILMDALDFQVRDDGTYCEQSSHYHCYTTDFYATLMILRQLEGLKIEPKHSRKLEQLFEFLLFITQPNGEMPLFGDDDGGKLYFWNDRRYADLRSTLALGAALLGRGDLKFGAKEADPELLWLLGPAGLSDFDKLDAFEPEDTTMAFREGGFFVYRDSWTADSNYLLIDCGEHGFLNGGHAHADALSFVMSIEGEPILIDSGTYNYTADLNARKVFRSTSSHNCLTVNGKSSSQLLGPFSWKSKAECRLVEWNPRRDLFIFRGTHDGFVQFGVQYERTITTGTDGYPIIADLIASEIFNSYSLNFILSPNLDVKITGRSAMVFDENKRKSVVLTVNTILAGTNLGEAGRWSMEDCLVSPKYGAMIPSKKLVFTIEAKGDLKIETVVST